MTPAPLQVGQAPSELALNRAGFTPLAFANAVRIGSSRPVYVAGLLRREPLIAPWSIGDDAVAARHRAVDERALARPGHAGQHDQHAERDVDVDVLQVVRAGAANLERARSPSARVGFSAARSSRCRPVSVSLARSRLDRALEDDLAAGRAGARPEVDDVVGDLDDLGLVLDDEDGVALVAQPSQQARSSAGCRADAARSWARRRRR